MKILNLRALRGPNFWSNWRHKLIVMLIDIEEMEEKPSSSLPGFTERLLSLLPTLYEHRCSLGYEGGFVERLENGTYMAHIIEHVALELQTLAGMHCGFGRARGYGETGVYNVVFSYEEERAGYYAANAAYNLVEALIEGKEPNNVEKDIQRLREIREEERFGPSTGSIVEEAQKRNIPIIRLNNKSLVQLGWGVHQQRIQATVTGKTSSIGLELASDKEATKNMLYNAGIPVPYGYILYSKEELKATLNEIDFPVVIKPVDGNQGKGATININTFKDAEVAFDDAQEYSYRVIVEKYVSGFDYRLLVINNQFVAAAKRTPAHIIGDGKSTIRQLIDEVNKDPKRGFGHEKVLTEIRVDNMTQHILDQENLTVKSVLPKDKILYLKTTANLSTGGISEDVTDSVHSYNIFMAERISRVIDLDICGIDVMAPNLTEPINDNGGAILEVNGAPGFRMHLAPAIGLARNVAEPVVDMLFQNQESGRIPIISVTGTNGKTTTTRLIAHIMKSTGKKVGYATTDGIYIQNRLLQKGDCSGPESAKFVLKDPTVNYAVLETARGGILRSGLGYDLANIGVVTNVSSDHLGLKGINTMDQMTRVKSVVAENVYPEGYTILNADDDYVYGMMENVSSNVALFSLDEENPKIEEHCNNGGIAAIYENGFITINKRGWKIRIDKVTNIPLTYDGRAAFQIQNVLASALAAFVEKVKVEDIRVALQTFVPSTSQTPGRMNIFELENFKVIMDYAHNPASMEAMGKFVNELGADYKVCTIAGTGDRRDQDMMDYGWFAAEYFDEVIVWEDKDYARGRDSEEILNIILEGVKSNPNKPKIEVIRDENDAVDYALKTAKPNSIITLFTGRIEEMTKKINRFKEKELDFNIEKEDIPNLPFSPTEEKAN